MAAYTTYRVTLAVIKFGSSRRAEAMLRLRRNIELIDALTAVLVLQNTLIIANENEISGNMKTLSIISSTAIWLITTAISAGGAFET